MDRVPIRFRRPHHRISASPTSIDVQDGLLFNTLASWNLGHLSGPIKPDRQSCAAGAPRRSVWRLPLAPRAKESPLRECGGLTAKSASGVEEIPERRAEDLEPAARGGDTDPIVALYESVASGALKEAPSLFLRQGFRREARGEGRELLPAHCEQLEGGCISISEYGVGLGAVGDDYEGREKQRARLFDSGT